MALDQIRVAVCDDHKTELLILDKLLRCYDKAHQLYDVEATYYSSPVELLEALKRGAVYEIFLLDVMMPQMNGIALGRKLREIVVGGEIIYITASEDYALEAFQVHAFNYLLKPLDPKELFTVLDEIIGRMFVTTIYKERFLVKTREGTRQIPLDGITHVENAGRALRVVLLAGSPVESVVSQKSFDEQTAALLQEPAFIRTHKSYVVNICYAQTLTDKEIQLANGYMVPVSRRYYAGVQKAFLYMSGAFQQICRNGEEAREGSENS